MGQGGTQPADDYAFFHVNGNTSHHLGTSSYSCIRESYLLLRR
jgi:hypothetical protein